ncbi:MAG: epoxyqueuosine reductase [Sporomusaceae bacterium]|nr:epoxyqueuosine reductase [Sporomusaceae bacterium]
MDLAAIIGEFVKNSPLNRLGDRQIFDEPLIGVAAADDVLFDSLKQADVVCPQHLSPREWLPEAKAVIAFFLPFSECVRAANRKPGVAAREWMIGRIEGEQVNDALRRHLLSTLQTDGCKAVVPPMDDRYAVVHRRSNWSERHVAFIAGLGTFSLSRSLITQKGSAGRLGSVIVDRELAATPRAYRQREAYCTHCGACILRCPPLAITDTGKDNAVCGEYLDRVLARFHPRYGCGKCQTGVPCEAGNPTNGGAAAR